MTRRKVKKPDPTSDATLHSIGFERGKSDWQAGLHTDPYIDDSEAYPAAADRHILSHGWGAGQDSMFRQAADEFDVLLHRHVRH